MDPACPPRICGVKPKGGRADPTHVDKRRKPRQQRRLSCELHLAGKRHTGIVRDVSEIGIYVQTRAKAAAGERIELVFAASGAQQEVRVKTRVVRLDRLTAHFATSGAGGLGLELTEPAGGLDHLLVEAGFANGAPAPAGQVVAMKLFRVKLTAITGGGTQTVRVNAPGKEGARSRALARAGKGWKVSEVCEG
jgi:Tfp pilus assembly protein PilZ